jgi:hypothetical protein
LKSIIQPIKTKVDASNFYNMQGISILSYTMKERLNIYSSLMVCLSKKIIHQERFDL